MTRTSITTSFVYPDTPPRKAADYLRRGLLSLVLVILASCAMSSSAVGQNIQFTQGSVGSGLENGLQISLQAYPGRGAASLPVTLYYSSKLWRIKHTGTIYNPSNVSLSEQMTEARYAEHSRAGWTSSLGVPTLEWPESTDVYTYKGKPVCLDCRNPPFSPNSYWKVPSLTVHMPDGSAHELRRDDQPYTGPVNNTGTYYAVDGSRLRYDTSSATLYLPDGSRYVLGETTVKFIDRNGNTLIYDRSNSQWTDTLGRIITSPLAGNGDYSIPGFNGSVMTYSLRWTQLQSVLEPDPETGVMPQLGYAGKHYVNGTPGVSNPPQLLPAPHLFQTMENGEGNNDYVLAPQALFNPVVLYEIVLPNGLKYEFKYNEYGEIAKVIYPTGAVEQYKYGRITTVTTMTSPYDQMSRGVVSRWISPSGTGSDRARWQYGAAYDATLSKYKQWTLAPDNTYTESLLFQSPPMPQYVNEGYARFGLQDPRNGMAYDERVYEYQNGPMLRRKLTAITCSLKDITVNSSGQNTVAPAMRNPRSSKVVSIILDTGGDGLAKTVTYDYDTTHQFSTGHDPTVTTESYFDSVNETTAQTGTISDVSPGPGTVVSRAETIYVNDAAYRDRNILGLANSVVLKGANGQPVSKTVMAYDQTALQSYNYFANDWTDPGTVRGNVTTVRRYIDALADVPFTQDCPSGVCLDTHAEFDQVGNVWKVRNERGIESQIKYSSTYEHAYATEAKTAAPDPNPDPDEAHGSNEAFTSSTTFDRTTGLALETIDANGQTTTFSYKNEQIVTDPLNRLRKVTRPDGGWTKYEFNDEVGNLYIRTQTKQDGTHTSESYQYFDRLGRASRGFVSEDGMSYIAGDTLYDQMGRVLKTSNPYRTTQRDGIAAESHTNNWTTSQYDALSRVDSVTLPDGSTTQTDYQGIYTTVTDQAGKQRRQKVDALGRIVRVDEPDSSGDLGEVGDPRQATYYDYNTQGSLIHIKQGAGANVQDRYFKYDALGRLTYERQVEQKGEFTVFDPLTDNSAWSRKLVYDETIENVNYRGLLTTVEDARNISTRFKYDNLNRVWQVTYSDGTPPVTNNYDQQRTGYFNKGRLTKALTAAVGSVPATAQVYDYDLMGRVTNNQQVVGDQTYSMSYGYNVGGALKSETYPSGRVVSYAFDSAARLAKVSSGSTVYANEFDYSSPQGLLKSVTLGNGAVESFDYNSRLQLKSIDLTKAGTVLQHYDYKYGVYNGDTNSLDETKNNGQIARIEGTIGTQKQWQQNFTYDSMGRLATAREFRGDNSQRSYLVNYDYDVFGNRRQKQEDNGGNPFPQIWTEVSDIAPTTNRLTNGVIYDDAGNVEIDPKYRHLKFEYDANNRQKQSSNLDGTGAVKSIYDAAGQRVATQIAGALTNVLVYDAMGKLVAEYGNSSSANGTQYVMADHQGSTRAVLNNAGTVVSRHDYLPFGEEVYAGVGMRSPGQNYNAADSVRQKYAGMETDDVTGMAHTLWRQYDSLSGRWTAPDPYGGSMTVADPQSFNRYSYVNNDPVNQIDPSGLMGMLPDASTSWSQISDGFWGNSFDFSGPARSAGRPIIANAEARHDGWVDKDRAGLEYGEEGDPLPEGDVTVSAEVTGVTEEPQRIKPVPESVVTGPYVFPAVADNPTIFMDSRGTASCATWAQLVAISLGQPLGPASNWIAGPKVMLNSSTMPGTVIGSGFNKRGRYPNKDEGNHIGFFLKFIPGGFSMMENVKGNVRIRPVTNANGGYFSNPNNYHVIMVPTVVKRPPKGIRIR